jgi:basic membrane protein A
MKKVLLALVLLVTVAVLVGCTQEKFEIALITDKGNIDDKSFNQGAWEGVVEYAVANEISHKYYKPEEASNDGYLASIDLAVEGGAKVIVTPGFLFEVPIYEAQTKYPDIKFILLDGSPHTADYSTFETKSNVASIMYAEEQSGYLAGYAAVKDGMRALGFMGGMAVPAVQAFGYGFLQGAEDAAAELALAAGAVTVTYHYTGNFDENDTNKATAKTMFQEGTEVIFAAGGSVGKSVMSAATETSKKVIGVDVDQRYDSATVITSAMKGLGASVVQVLTAYYGGTWATFGGKSTSFNAANDGIGLPTVVLGDATGNAFDRFSTFNKAAYDVVFAKLVAGTTTTPVLLRSITVAATSGAATATELTTGLGLTLVTVTVR